VARLITAFFALAVLGAAQYVPQTISGKMEARQQTEQELAAKLVLDPNNISLLLRMGSMKVEDAGPLRDGDTRTSVLDEAQGYYQRVLQSDPQNTKALYSIGVIGWMRVYPALRTARVQLGMNPEAAGPLRDREARAVLNAKYGSVISNSLIFLERVLAIDPQNNDSMAYMNLVYRAKADLQDTAEAYSADIATADKWVQKALETARVKQEAGINPSFAQAPPPPPPPPPPPSPGEQATAPTRIRVGGNVQESNLIHKVDPEYPAQALQARIQGTVRFNATIAKDGTMMNLQVVSGHPLLVQPAVEAVKHWIYKPTMLNGEPVEVITTIDVNFTLP
jgi:TonB family protein